MNIKEFYSTTETAGLLGISRVTVFNWIKSGKLKANKVGRNFIVPGSELAKFLPSHLTEEKKKNIQKIVSRTFKEYGETLRLLGQE